jgi:hypothetical protein
MNRCIQAVQIRYSCTVAAYAAAAHRAHSMQIFAALTGVCQATGRHAGQLARKDKAAYAGLHGRRAGSAQCVDVGICTSVNTPPGMHDSIQAVQPKYASTVGCICTASTQTMQYAGSCNVVRCMPSYRQACGACMQEEERCIWPE